MRRLGAVLLTWTAVLASIAGAAIAAGVPASGVTVTVRRDVVYRTVDGDRLRLDAYLPAGRGPRPAVVLVHGGGWRGGDKRNFAPQGKLLAELGYVAFSVDYRLAPGHPYPAAVDDVQAAVAWARAPAQVEKYGVDPARIGTLGGSAGGNLVGMLATLGEGPLVRDSRVAAAVSWSGPMDLPAAMASVATGPAAASTRRSVEVYLGCAPSACPEHAAAASPITHIDPSDAPLLLVNSTNELVPVDQARSMASRLEQAGVAHDLVIVPGRAHAEALAPRVWDDTVAFLREHLGAGGAAGTPTTEQAARSREHGGGSLSWLIAGAVTLVVIAIVVVVVLIRRRSRAQPAR